MDDIGGVPIGLAAQLREAVVSLGTDGTIEWANTAATRMLRVSEQELLGTSALDRVHPAEVARALDGIAFSADHPERTAVVPFRLRRGDETWADVELMSSVVRAPDGDHLVLVLRDATPRRALAEALASVAAGAPIDVTARWLARVIESRWPATLAAVLLEDRHGVRLLGAESWDDDLCAVLVEVHQSRELWRAAVATDEVAVRVDDQIPAAARAVAARHGLTTFAVAPVPDPGGGHAALVAWFDLTDAASMEFGHASDELRELLRLGLERQHHLGQLDHAVRHDELTGLLNRAGFLDLVDQLERELQAADQAADPAPGGHRRAALLYLDLDAFKPVNDGYGHAVGDAVLQVVAGRLAELAGSWAVARIGGDEFVLLGAGREGLADEAAALADSAVASLAAPIEVAGHDGDVLILQVGASIGVAVTDPGIEVHRLLERADGAMYSVKAAGGRNWSVRLPG